MESKKSNAGALPSNAGDDFHLLWAAQKVLEMLKPSTTLTAVTVEGPTWKDSIIADIDDSKLYAIDLAEYYGGTDFQSAAKIVFSQLKYSTYMGDVEWTAANLCNSSNKKKDNSIIRRLADTYKEYTEKNVDSEDKLFIKLVSNRSISDCLNKSIKETKENLAEKSYKQTSTLIKSLSPESKIEIERLYKESNLSSKAFLSFIKMLNFEDCGTATRSIQKAEIIQLLGNWGIDSLQNKYNEIIMTIRDRMMPGRNADVAMTKDFVCSLFGGNFIRFFPAPTNIPLLKTGYIERECVHDLVKIALGEEKSPIFVHATAGIGKTTLVSNIEKYLPDGSAVIFYDCYGGGTYLQPSDSRYECDTAIPQICNNLALECKTEFLLERRLKDSEFFQELYIRLDNAVKYVKSFSESAIVLLIIDAADNAVFAAKQNGRNCFIDKLLKQHLPHGVRLLLTYRTEHADYFAFPDKSIFYEIPTFNLRETTAHVKSFFPTADKEVCLEFQNLSKGIPRVQAYVLDSKRDSTHELIDILRPDGKTTEDLLNYILEEISQRYGEGNEEISLIFGVLINLPRPIPITIATKILCCSSKMLQSLSVDCSFGLYIENDYIYFRDEDFETFLREKYCDNLKAISTITDYMYQHRHQDIYCAKYVHSFLAKQTDDISKLLNISLKESIDESLVDITEASRIMISRIKATLSILTINTNEYWEESFQLIYKLIDFSKSDEAIYKLIESNPEQGYLYCDNSTLLKVFTTDRNDFDSLGKAAFIFSMKPETKSKALSYLDSYRGAIDYFYSKSKEEQKSVQRPRLGDIINVAESLLRLKDVISMKRWVTSWINKKFQANILFEVLVRLFDRNDMQLINQVESIQWSFHCKLSIVSAYLKSKKAPPVFLVEYLIKVLNKIQNINLDNFNKEHLILFLEYLCKDDKDRDMILRFISKYQINYSVSYLPYINGQDEKELDCNIRFYVLEKTLRNENIKSEDFCDKDNLKKDSRFTQQKIDERIKDIKKVYDFLLPAYKNRIQVICRFSRETTEELYKECLTKLERMYWYDQDIQKSGSIRLYLLALADAVLNINTIDSHAVHNLLVNIAKTTRIYRDTKFALADLCSHDERSYRFTLETLKSISDELTQYPISAMEASEAYIQCATIGQKVEKIVGQNYYEKALQSAKGLDYESYRKLELFNILTNTASNKGYLSDVELSHEFMRLAEDYYRKMGDSKNFPYKDVFEAAIILCPENIFSIMCRIDDRNDFDHFSLSESSIYILSGLLERGIYKSDIIASMSAILLPEQPSDYYNIVEKIIQQLKRESISIKQKSLDILIHDVLYNVPLGYKHSLTKIIITFINEYKLYSCKDYQEIIKLYDFLDSINNQETEIHQVEYKETTLLPSMEFCEENHPISDSIQLLDYLKKLDRDNQINFVDLWLTNTSIEDYVSNANILIETCLNGIYSIECSKIMDIFIKHINIWSVWPSVEAWRNDENIQRKIFLNHMDKILTSYNNYYDKLTSIFNVQTIDIQTFFIEYLVQHNNIPNENIIEILKKLSLRHSENFAHKVLKWCISEEVPSIHPMSGDKPFSITFSQIDQELLPICKLLWRILGHPDKKYRWIAMHIIKNLYSSGYSSIIGNLITLYDAPFDSRYMDTNNFFFIESAKIYFLIICLRIFGEEPKGGVSFYEFFKEIACSNQTTHALQRRLAKHISLKIAEISCPSDIDKLLLSDELKHGKIKMASRYSRASFSNKQKFLFDFDYMDTLPYWYNDLANIFNLTQEEVAKSCDNYIQQFGIDNEKTRIWSSEYLHYNRYRSRNTYNNQGCLPEIETLEKYAEWHAMFYVADQYRCTMPYSEDSYESYHDWLDSYFPGYKGRWSCEYRNHIPFVPFLWEFKKYKSLENDNEYMIEPSLINSLILNRDSIITCLNYNSSFDQSSQRIKIKSALINEKDISKLISELKKPHSLFEYFYFEPDSEERRHYKKTDLTIWPINIYVNTLRDDRLDQHDSFSKDVTPNISSFSQDILDFGGYKDLDVEILSLPAKNKNLPFRIVNWSEPNEEGGYTKQGTYGNMAEIKAEILLKYLKSIKKALIFEYSIVFEDQGYHFYGTPSKPAKEKGVFIIYSNGSTESCILRQNQDIIYD